MTLEEQKLEELGPKLDLPGIEIPKRQLIGNICQWEYRSSECSYTGSNFWNVEDQSVSTLAEDRCGKRLDSCKLRFGNNAELPFGSFPTAGRTR
jgi:lambda family phage minor tail protein L